MFFCRLAILCTFFLATTSGAWAQDLLQKIKGDGSSYGVTLSPEQVGKKLIFWVDDRGNISEFFTVGASGPLGASVSVEYAPAPKKKPSAAFLSSSGGWIPASFSGGSGKSKNVMVLKSNAAKRTARYQTQLPGNFGSLCSFIPPDMMNALIDQYTKMLGHAVTKDDICSGKLGGVTSSGGTPIPTDPFNGLTGIGGVAFGTSSDASGHGVIHKNSCAGGSSTHYAIRIVVDLSKVKPEALAANNTLSVALLVDKYKGDRAATIKPSSDGKYAGHPIILMSSVGGMFGGSEEVNLYHWRGRKVGPKRKLKVVKYAFYQGKTLALSLLDGVLNGGKGVFELTNGTRMYSVCFTLQRSRQAVNGYPTPH